MFDFGPCVDPHPSSIGATDAVIEAAAIRASECAKPLPGTHYKVAMRIVFYTAFDKGHGHFFSKSQMNNVGSGVWLNMNVNASYAILYIRTNSRREKHGGRLEIVNETLYAFDSTTNRFVRQHRTKYERVFYEPCPMEVWEEGDSPVVIRFEDLPSPAQEQARTLAARGATPRAASLALFDGGRVAESSK